MTAVKSSLSFSMHSDTKSLQLQNIGFNENFLPGEEVTGMLDGEKRNKEKLLVQGMNNHSMNITYP